MKMSWRSVFTAGMIGFTACVSSTLASAQSVPDETSLAAVAPGRWIGFGICGASEITFTLAIRKDAAAEGDFVAEAGGGLAPMTLAGRPEGQGQTMLLRAKAWRMEDPSRQTSQFDLEITYLPQAKMLAITRIGVESECRNLVARKILTPELPSNPKGLLFESRAEPSAEDCGTYALWMAERYRKLDASKHIPRTYAALYDPEGMVRVLGRDFLSWTNEDATRLKNLGLACQAILKGARNPKLTAAVGVLDAEGWAGAPLTYRPDVPDSRLWYGPALGALYADMIGKMRVDQFRLTEGFDGGGIAPSRRYGDRRARLASAPRDAFVGEWFGTISCGAPAPAGTADRLVRLLVDTGSGEQPVELHLGPYHDAYTGSVGVYEMLAKYDAQTHSVSMQKAGGAVAAKHIKGSFDPKTGVLTGTAIGFTELANGGCTQLSMRKVERQPAPKNPDGLLFQIVLDKNGGLAAHSLTPGQCKEFFAWQTQYRTATVGNRAIYGGLFDAARMRAVFGKDIIQWDDADAARMMVLRPACRQVLQKDNNPGRLAVMKSVNPDTWYGWAILETWPRRVKAGGQIEISAEWFRTEHAMRAVHNSAELSKAK